MLEWIAALQPPLIGAVLAWSAGVKLFTRSGKIAAATTALGRIVGTERAPLAYRGVGAAEAALAVLLLAPPAWSLEAAAAIAAGVGFTGYLLFARLAAPESSCGCMSAKQTPISWRSFGRALWLVAAGGVALFAGETWFTAIGSAPTAAAGILLAELALFAALSPELDSGWLVPLRRLQVRLTKPLGADTATVPLDHSLAQLRNSPSYRAVAAALRTDVRESWEEDGWRIVLYGGRYRDREVTAVFAAPLDGYHPDKVRVALVDDETSEVHMRLDGSESLTTTA